MSNLLFVDWDGIFQMWNHTIFIHYSLDYGRNMAICFEMWCHPVGHPFNGNSSGPGSLPTPLDDFRTIGKTRMVSAFHSDASNVADAEKRLQLVSINTH